MNVLLSLAVVMVTVLVFGQVTLTQSLAREPDTSGSKSKFGAVKSQSHQNEAGIKSDLSTLDRVARGLACSSGSENCGKIPIVNPNANPPLRDPGAFPQSVGNTPVSSRPNSPQPKPTHLRGLEQEN